MSDLQSFIQAAGGPLVSPPRPDRRGSEDSVAFMSISDEEEIVAPPESPVEVIERMEKNLTEPVQDLLDKLNTISDKMNDCECKISQMDAQKRTLYSNWNAQKKILFESIGMHSIEKTKPVFDAYEKQQLAQSAVNETTALFLECVAECKQVKDTLASTQGDPAEILKLSIEAQTKRDAIEQLNRDKMEEFNLAQAELVNIRKAVGMRLIQKAWPWFEAYTNHKAAYEKIFNATQKLRTEMKALKANYRLCMSQLESISDNVHKIRNNQDSSH